MKIELNYLHFVSPGEIINNWYSADWPCLTDNWKYCFVESVDCKCSVISPLQQWEQVLNKCASEENFNVIYESILYNGFLVPLTARAKDGKIIFFDGHHRLLAAKMLQMEKIPVFIASDDKSRFDLVAIDSSRWTRINQSVDQAPICAMI